MKESSFIIAFERLDSTNRYLKQSLEENPFFPEGTLVIAWEQTAGYGQYQRAWYSKKGESLTFSILFYPWFLKPDEQQWLLFFTASTLVSALRDYTKLPIGIKWPNDLYLFGKKLGGVLVENQIQEYKIASSIIGIGLNVNNEEFPQPLQSTAISLFQASKQFYDLKPLVQYLHETMLEKYSQFKQGIREFYYQAYQSYLFHNEKIEFEDLIENRKKSGDIIQVLPSGHIKIKTDSEQSRTYAPGQIKIISPVS